MKNVQVVELVDDEPLGSSAAKAKPEFSAREACRTSVKNVIVRSE